MYKEPNRFMRAWTVILALALTCVVLGILFQAQLQISLMYPPVGKHFEKYSEN